MRCYFLRHDTPRLHPGKQVCYCVEPEFAPGTFSWVSGMPLPVSLGGPVKYELEELFPLADYIPAVTAPVLVSSRLAFLILDLSESARAYPALILHKNNIVRDDVKALNFERCIECVDESASALEYLDLGGGTSVPYRYRRLELESSRIPPSEAVFRVQHCPDLIVTQVFRDAAEQEGITGCEYFSFQGINL